MKLMVPAIKPAGAGPDRQDGSQETVELLQAIDALLAEASGAVGSSAGTDASLGNVGKGAPSSGTRAQERAR
ncbi:MAG TPA: hypothetical protein VL984_05720 [Acidimicrobiales bacterium]|nr:hypothetical protein [Acidimicrobiales bacterium]